MAKRQHEQSEPTPHSEIGGSKALTAEARKTARAVKVTAPTRTADFAGLTAADRAADRCKANGFKSDCK